jgi:glycerol kinase
MGQACFTAGEAKNTYGTGNFMLLNTGSRIVPASAGLLTTVAYALGDADPVCALEGSVAVTGSAVQWLRDQLEVLKVDGGVTVNNLLMQMQADILGVPVARPVVAETTALAAAYAAGLAVGFWPDLDTLRRQWKAERQWEPRWNDDQRGEAYRGWLKAVERSFGWAH